jgi:hypothetical protein
MAIPFDQAYIARRVFALKLHNGAEFGRVGFGADGRLFGRGPKQDTGWSLADGTLSTLNADGSTNKQFDRFEIAGGRLVLLGHGTRNPSFYEFRLVEERADAESIAPFTEPGQDLTPAANPLAVLVRSNRWDEKAADLWRKLERSAEGSFDVFALLDESKGRFPVDVPEQRIIWHSADMCRAMGLTQQTHVGFLWYCGDAALYCGVRARPNYRYYLMIEDDVDFTRDDATFIRDLCTTVTTGAHAGIDFIGLLMRPLALERKTPAHRHFAQPYYSYFPFVLFSRRLAAYCFVQRQLEAIRMFDPDDIVHVESFTASHAQAGGFVWKDLSEVMPGAYNFASMHKQAMPSMGRPLGAPVVEDAGIQIMHPIFGHERYAQKMKQIFADRRDWANLRRHLDSEEARVVPPELLAPLRSILEEGVTADAKAEAPTA